MARISILDPPEVAVEQRAEQISDPVARLRFLRQEMRPQPARRPVVSRSVARNGAFAFALIALIGLLPLPTGTAETLAKERKLIVPEVTNTANAPLPHVWMVEHSDALEVYSNGLRIDLTFTVANHPRRPFPIFSVPGGVKEGEGDKPVGIVFHTTESLLAPFEEQQNRRLRLIGRSLIEIVRTEHSYHYLIDRFGRVYRVVQESDAANHAGVSIWADSQGAYVNLNDSFLGISFEGQTGAINEVTQAQITSGKVLTEMLRSKYGISTEDCVTHAQVSVNPQNMKIGSTRIGRINSRLPEWGCRITMLFRWRASTHSGLTMTTFFCA